MEDQAIGWIAAIVIGGIAGWLAERFMKSDMGHLMNIVLGIIGAAEQLAVRPHWYLVRARLDRLFDRRLHRGGHPDLRCANGSTTGVIKIWSASSKHASASGSCLPSLADRCL